MTTRESRRSEVTDLTYREVARRYRVTLCDQACVLRSLLQHTNGFVLDGVVHWKDRILVKRGLYTFLKLVAQNAAFDPETPRIKMLWLRASEAYHLGLELGVRFPREFAATDRAQVRAELAATGPGGMLPLTNEDKERIERWARE